MEVGIAVLSLVLLATSGMMIDSSLRRWREKQASGGGEDKYYRRQFRRRMQANIMIGVVGVLVAIWPVVREAGVGMKIAHLALLLIAVMWMVAMAMLDAWAINQRYRRDRMQQIADQARFALEMQRKKLEPTKEATGEES